MAATLAPCVTHQSKTRHLGTDLLPERAIQRDWDRRVAVILGVDGISDFNALHSRRYDDEVQFCAFDILARVMICANCRCRCARPTLSGCWHVCSKASSLIRLSAVRLVLIFLAGRSIGWRSRTGSGDRVLPVNVGHEVRLIGLSPLVPDLVPSARRPRILAVMHKRKWPRPKGCPFLEKLFFANCHT
jgi:hypothetical protein